MEVLTSIFFQVIHYFRNFPNDRLAKKLLVLFLLTMDILSEASHNLELYMVCDFIIAIGPTKSCR
jgi:hypothetical protein